jgi:CHASE2 domain
VAPPMAALALYEAYCARQRAIGNANVCPPGWTPPISAELSLSWGYGAAPQAFANKDDNKCLMPDGGLATRAWLAAKQAFGSIFRAAWTDKGKDRAESPCIYSDVITASQLLRARPDQEAELKRLIANRVVLVGAAHSFTTDLHSIPLVGRVPGVLIHAMATDNLITNQHAYTRTSPNLIFDLDFADVIEIGLTLALIVMMWRAQLAGARANEKAARRRALAIGAAACVGVIVVVLVVEHVFLHWPAYNVLGVGALALSVITLWGKAAERIAEEERRTAEEKLAAKTKPS